MFTLAVWESLLTRISDAMGIQVPSNALFMLALLFLSLMALHFSLLVSRLTDQCKVLAQKLALLERDLRQERSGGWQRPDEDSPADESRP